MSITSLWYQRPAQLHRTDDRTVILVVGGAYGALYTVAGIRAGEQMYR